MGEPFSAASRRGLWRAGRAGARPCGDGGRAAALPSLAGVAVGWTGSAAAGDPAGAASSLPWAIAYAHPASPAFADGAPPRTPVAAYELLLTAAGRAWRAALGKARAPRGMLMPLALAAWGAGRFLIAFVRLDPAWLGLQQTQWIGLIALAAAALCALRSRRAFA